MVAPVAEEKTEAQGSEVPSLQSELGGPGLELSDSRILTPPSFHFAGEASVYPRHLMAPPPPDLKTSVLSKNPGNQPVLQRAAGGGGVPALLGLPLCSPGLSSPRSPRTRTQVCPASRRRSRPRFSEVALPARPGWGGGGSWRRRGAVRGRGWRPGEVAAPSPSRCCCCRRGGGWGTLCAMGVMAAVGYMAAETGSETRRRRA